ncbi:hypothetical protein [Erwinia sp. V71]|uniref:hypothetical protein n=1 Tax=Erwinia sp. V71 TaxID=3369424 RepID=UPI003F5EC89D
MTSFNINKNEKLFLHLKNIDKIDPGLKGKIIKSLDFINERSLFMGDDELIIVDVV